MTCFHFIKYILGYRDHTNNKMPITFPRQNRIFRNAVQRIHRKKYKYKKTNYISRHDKVIVTCKKHGDFKILPGLHLKGIGCIHCCNENKESNFEKMMKYYRLLPK